MVRLGNIIPADLKLAQGEYLTADQSALTDKTRGKLEVLKVGGCSRDAIKKAPREFRAFADWVNARLQETILFTPGYRAMRRGQFAGVSENRQRHDAADAL